MEHIGENTAAREEENNIPQKVAVLVAWPYANGPRHLGHGASLVPGDVIARYHRSIGNDVLMVSGTDEYGTPNMIAAEKSGKDPEVYVDETNELIRNDFIDLGMSFDWFTRTTSTEHVHNAQGVFAKLVESGYIVKDTMLGAFDSENGQSLPDRYVEGGCPNCSASSRGDQCEGCSSMLDPKDLINPISKITKNPVEFKNTEHYFLQLDKLAPDVIEWLESNQELRANAKSASIDMAKSLHSRAITRDMNWGIPLPEDFELNSENEKVLYVWFEAVIGYLSASIEWAKDRGNPEEWKDWWQNNEARHYYAMGKDNVPFHTIIWPAILSAADKSGYSDKELHKPDVIASTEFLTFNESKLSSSRDNVVYVSDMLELIGPDALRYYLIAAGPETHDTNFSFHELTRRVNDELLAKWGNLVSRSVSLIHKNHNGQIPEVAMDQLENDDNQLLQEISNTYNEAGKLLNEARFSAALKVVMDTTAIVNKYIFDKAPWKTAKEDRGQADKDMFVIMTAIENLNVLFSPFLPHASQRVHELLGYTTELSSQSFSKTIEQSGEIEVLTGDYRSNLNHWKFTYAKSGQKIKTTNDHLFKKIDEEQLLKDFEALALKRKIGKTAISMS